MERLRSTFARLRRQRRKALIPFVMGGDPSLAITPKLILCLQDAGADVIEVGIPFSDPLADGPVIQAAAARALSQGATPRRLFQTIAGIRRQLRVPLVALTYYNLVIQFARAGGDRGSVRAFMKAAHDSGFSGVVVPDVPVEEGSLLRQEVARQKMAAIFLAAPTSPPSRLRAVAKASRGFIYSVSVTGTTGMRQALPAELTHSVRQLKLLTTKPVCVGFGISTAAQAAAVARVADGVIVGSALVKKIAEAKGSLKSAARFVASLRRSLDR